MALGKPTGLKPRPEQDGSHQITIETPNGETVVVEFAASQVRHFVEVMQAGILDRWSGTGPTPQFPFVAIHNATVGHGSEGTVELMVSSDPIGTVTWIASDDVLLTIKREIDRILEMRKAKKRPAN